MFSKKSIYALAVALPVSVQVATPATAIELSPPPSPPAPAIAPLDSTFPMFIESGSAEDFVDADGRTWRADVGFIKGSVVDRGAIEIDGTTSDRVYQTERWGLDGYLVKVPNGKYLVNLHFAETYQDAVGKRVFSVNVEDQVISDLDIFAETGAQNKALVKAVEDVVVSDGDLNIDFVGAGAMINGVAILAVAPALAFEGGSVAEDAPAGQQIGTVRASSGTDGGVHFSLSDDGNGRFIIDSDTGVLRVAASGVLDFEEATSHRIVVTATDARGAIAEAAFTITVLDVAEASTDLHFTHILPEDASHGAKVGIVAPVDPALARNVAFSLSDDADGRFAIDAGSGIVSVADGAVLDYETFASHNITAVASNGAGVLLERTFTVAIEDINEPPTGIALSAQTVDEAAPAGTVVGVATALDPDADEAFNYGLVKDADGRFVIDEKSGVVSVASGAELDAQLAASHRIVVEASDSAGHTLTEGFTIVVEAVREVPTSIFIEAGGEIDHVDDSGRTWIADTGFTGGEIVDRGAIEIEATVNDRIYQTERWGVSGYTLPLATGIYTVKLHFAETMGGVDAAGKRVFSVDVEGRAVKDLDVFAEAGIRTALVKTVRNVIVSDGQLNIAFEAKTGPAIINAIEVEPVLTCEAAAR